MKYNRKKGFTLVELLAVIALIALLAVLTIPNIINVNNNINKKISSQKIEYIESAAELYGINNSDIFNDNDEKTINIQKLLDNNYIEADTPYNKGKCIKENICAEENLKDDQCNSDNVKNDATIKNTGCITDNEGNILNGKNILLTKKVAGVVAELDGNSTEMVQGTLVQQVCKGFGVNFNGKTLKNKECKCNDDYTKLISNGVEATECIIVSNKENGEVNNWLQYGSDKPNWRVLGLYKMEDGKLSAKIITNEPID